MKMNEYKAIIEGLLFAAGDEGLSLKQIASVLEMTEEQVLPIIGELKADYDEPGRGIQLIELAGVFQLATKKEHAPYLKKTRRISRLFFFVASGARDAGDHRVSPADYKGGN